MAEKRKRGRKVDPDSMNQRIKRAFFGDRAELMSNVWRKWPDPYYGIYRRLLNGGLQLVDADEHRRLKKVAGELEEELQEVKNEI